MHRELDDIERETREQELLVKEANNRLQDLHKEYEKTLQRHAEIALLDTITDVIAKPERVKLKKTNINGWYRTPPPFQSQDPTRYTACIRSQYVDTKGKKHNHYIKCSIWLSEAQHQAHITIAFGSGNYMYNHNEKNLSYYGDKSLGRASTIKFDPEIDTLDQCKSALLQKLQKAQENKAKQLAKTP